MSPPEQEGQVINRSAAEGDRDRPESPVAFGGLYCFRRDLGHHPYLFL